MLQPLNFPTQNSLIRLIDRKERKEPMANVYRQSTDLNEEGSEKIQPAQPSTQEEGTTPNQEGVSDITEGI